MSGVHPPLGSTDCPARACANLVLADGEIASAPASISSATASALFSCAAQMRAVSPNSDSGVSTLAPRTSSALIASVLPVRAAVISTVSP